MYTKGYIRTSVGFCTVHSDTYGAKTVSCVLKIRTFNVILFSKLIIIVIINICNTNNDDDDADSNNNMIKGHSPRQGSNNQYNR